MAKPRRSDVASAQSAPIDARKSELPFSIQIVCSLAVSALGLALAGGISLTAGAQSSIVGGTIAGGSDTSKAIPIPGATGATDTGPANGSRAGSAPNDARGVLSELGPQSYPGSTELRRAIDRALAGQLSQERSLALERTGNSQIGYSAAALVDARTTNLRRISEQQRREAARLAEEKRKAEEALRRAEQARIAAEQARARIQNLPAAPQAPFVATPSTSVIMDSGGMNDRAATPLKPGSYVLSAPFGAVGSWARYHTGQDLSAPIGTPIRAAADGIVMTPDAGSWAGTHVIINHGALGQTLYAHMQQAIVHPGQWVQHGQVIGYVGMTGRSFGPHLHFEYYPPGTPTTTPYVTTDPYAFMLKLGIKL